MSVRDNQTYDANYKQGKQLGSGAFSDVFRCTGGLVLNYVLKFWNHRFFSIFFKAWFLCCLGTERNALEDKKTLVSWKRDFVSKSKQILPNPNKSVHSWIVKLNPWNMAHKRCKKGIIQFVDRSKNSLIPAWFLPFVFFSTFQLFTALKWLIPC